MSRGFEKISLEQFIKDVKISEVYDEYTIPVRSTTTSAGYDIKVLYDITINPNEIVKIPTGLKAYMLDDECMLIIVRGSVGVKHNIRMCNQVGLIDSDYYNNVNNEGHIWVTLQNHGKNVVNFKKGDRIVQAIFIKYLKTDQDIVNEKRIGGFGSTDGGNYE